MLTTELIEARSGSITASQAHRIMTGWDTPRPDDAYPAELYDWIARHGRKPLVGDVKKALDCEVSGALIGAAWKAYQFDQPSQGLITYAEELACDELFEHDPMTDVNTRAMEAGNERELEAMERLSKATGLNFVNTGDEQVHIAVNGIGATPDGLVYDELDLILTGGEAKSRTPLHHARQLLINNNATLIEHDFDRYCQIQVSCFVTGASFWYSVNFNPYAKRPEHQLHYCIINRDDAFLKVFQQRAAMVFKHKALFLDQLNSIGAREKAA